MTVQNEKNLGLSLLDSINLQPQPNIVDMLLDKVIETVTSVVDSGRLPEDIENATVALSIKEKQTLSANIDKIDVNDTLTYKQKLSGNLGKFNGAGEGTVKIKHNPDNSYNVTLSGSVSSATHEFENQNSSLLKNSGLFQMGIGEEIEFRFENKADLMKALDHLPQDIQNFHQGLSNPFLKLIQAALSNQSGSDSGFSGHIKSIALTGSTTLELESVFENKQSEDTSFDDLANLISLKGNADAEGQISSSSRLEFGENGERFLVLEKKLSGTLNAKASGSIEDFNLLPEALQKSAEFDGQVELIEQKRIALPKDLDLSSGFKGIAERIKDSTQSYEVVQSLITRTAVDATQENPVMKKQIFEKSFSLQDVGSEQNGKIKTVVDAFKDFGDFQKVSESQYQDSQKSHVKKYGNDAAGITYEKNIAYQDVL